MPKYYQEDLEISDEVNLLISILVRYPEIASISIDPNTETISMSFMLSSVISEQSNNNIKLLFVDSIAALHKLKNIKSSTTDFTITNIEKMSIISVIRDVATMTKNEINLIISLLRDNFTDILIIDNNGSMLEEDLLVQDELIEDILTNMQQEHPINRLIGIREDGRVLVFNK